MCVCAFLCRCQSHKLASLCADDLKFSNGTASNCYYVYCCNSSSITTTTTTITSTDINKGSQFFYLLESYFWGIKVSFRRLNFVFHHLAMPFISFIGYQWRKNCHQCTCVYIYGPHIAHSGIFLNIEREKKNVNFRPMLIWNLHIKHQKPYKIWCVNQYFCVCSRIMWSFFPLPKSTRHHHRDQSLSMGDPF